MILQILNRVLLDLSKFEVFHFVWIVPQTAKKTQGKVTVEIWWKLWSNCL